MWHAKIETKIICKIEIPKLHLNALRPEPRHGFQTTANKQKGIFDKLEAPALHANNPGDLPQQRASQLHHLLLKSWKSNCKVLALQNSDLTFLQMGGMKIDQIVKFSDDKTLEIFPCNVRPSNCQVLTGQNSEHISLQVCRRMFPKLLSQIPK